MIVELTAGELFQTAIAGALRTCSAMAKGRRPAHGIPDSETWQRSIEGMIGEAVLAKALGQFWSPTLTRPDTLTGDVGPYQVRTTTHRDGHLILYPSDVDAATFVLVTGTYPRCRVAGWIVARDGKIKSNWTTEINGRPVRCPAYFVPQSALQPFETLPRVD